MHCVFLVHQENCYMNSGVLAKTSPDSRGALLANMWHDLGWKKASGQKDHRNATSNHERERGPVTED